MDRLKALVSSVKDNINKYSDEELSFKPAPGKWSKKEILGHLCDSAVNNLSRFINAHLTEKPYTFSGYDQDEWVKMNDYNNLSINDVVDMFIIFNNRIIDVVSKIPADKLNVICVIGDNGFRENSGRETLEWLIEDYIAHMEYHLKQIL